MQLSQNLTKFEHFYYRKNWEHSPNFHAYSDIRSTQSDMLFRQYISHFPKLA